MCQSLGKPAVITEGGQQAAAADWRYYGIEIGIRFEQLEGRRALPCNHCRVVVGVNEARACRTLHFCARLLPRRDIRRAE